MILLIKEHCHTDTSEDCAPLQGPLSLVPVTDDVPSHHYLSKVFLTYILEH
jgi:hypothetical protein